ncbi:winged helix-turn-helix transcriptional regulator [Aquabacter spiritensis]|uniref:HxlR family transcriptional regulator n=1 Tax=Aquabacter spiritensis TaxID=933073 RepID=A0A4R3LP85_9HYPH|nr:helix-turn-helix domain-containing protein [Aquabacter spiritensis]TCT02182.1 HxlR family transcriptional regulator [Aquabacter spiritensis]
MAKRHIGYCYAGCPVEAALEIIGAKWKGGTIYHLLSGEKRFSELRRLMPNVSQRILSKALRELEADGILLRTVYPAVPPQVGYRLTEKGEALRPAVLALRSFGAMHLPAQDRPVAAE